MCLMTVCGGGVSHSFLFIFYRSWWCGVVGDYSQAEQSGRAYTYSTTHLPLVLFLSFLHTPGHSTWWEREERGGALLTR